MVSGCVLVLLATPMSLGAGSVPAVTVADMLIMRASAGKPQPDQDVRGLIDVQGSAIDMQRLLDADAAAASVFKRETQSERP